MSRLFLVTAAPAALLVATILHPAHGLGFDTVLRDAGEARSRYYASHLTLLVAAALIVPLVMELARAAGDSRRVRFATAISLAGTVGFGALVGTDLLVWRVAEPGTASAARVDALSRLDYGTEIFVPIAILSGALLAGLALLAYALDSARAGPRWACVVLGAAPAVWALTFLAAPAVAGVAAAALVTACAALARETTPAR